MIVLALPEQENGGPEMSYPGRGGGAPRLQVRDCFLVAALSRMYF